MPAFVRRLTLHNFRNYHAASLDTDAPTIVLVGPNGAGKTNLIEAISFLAPGRGLRRATLTEVAFNEGDGSWAVAAEVEIPDLVARLCVEDVKDARPLDSEYQPPAHRYRSALEGALHEVRPLHLASARVYRVEGRIFRGVLVLQVDPFHLLSVEGAVVVFRHLVQPLGRRVDGVVCERQGSVDPAKVAGGV